MIYFISLIFSVLSLHSLLSAAITLPITYFSVVLFGLVFSFSLFKLVTEVRWVHSAVNGTGDNVKRMAWSTLFTGPYLFLAMTNFKNVSLWLDEMIQTEQVFSWTQDFLLIPIWNLHQPLFFLIYAPYVKLFGLSEIGVRLFPIIFGTLTIYVMSLFLLSQVKRLQAFWAVLLFSTLYWWVWSSIELKSVTLFLFLFVLLLNEFQKTFVSKKIGAPFYLTVFWLILSTQFQPLVALSALGLAFLFLDRDWLINEKIKATLVVFGLFGITSPFVLASLAMPSAQGLNAFRFLKSFDLGYFNQKIDLIFFDLLKWIEFSNVLTGIFLFYATVFFGLLYFIPDKNKFLRLLGLSIILQSVFILAFFTVIDWPFQNRYIIPVWFSLCLYFALGIEALSSSRFKHLNNLAVGVIAFFSVLPILNLNAFRAQQLQTDAWREMYSSFAAIPSGLNKAYLVDLSGRPQFKHIFSQFIGHRFYLQNQVQFVDYNPQKTEGPLLADQFLTDHEMWPQADRIILVNNLTNSKAHYFKTIFELGNWVNINYQQISNFELLILNRPISKSNVAEVLRSLMLVVPKPQAQSISEAVQVLN